MLKKIIAFAFLIIVSFNLNSQENNSSWWKKNTSFTGYIKYLNTTTFKNFNFTFIDNQIHNRINFKAYISNNITFDLQIRNRFLWGQSLQIPNFKKFINTENDIDLSIFLIDKSGLLLHSKIDRLSLTYNYGDWEFKAGRQRINWGKTWAWNTNDLFNAYNFLDFDYEERPGSDALGIQYNYGESSAIQAVYSYSKDFDKTIIAFRSQFNIKTYDIQLIAAKYYKDIALGIGWEGYLWNADFKGETTVFIPQKDAINSKTSLLSSISVDYFFKNGFMLIGNILYKSNGITDFNDFDFNYFLSESLTAKNLMPNRLSYLMQGTYQINPQSSATMGIMLMQELPAIGLLPSYSYNLAENWDLDFFGQLFFGNQNDKFKNIQNGIYLRLRRSY